MHGGGSKAFMQMLDGMHVFGVESFVIFPDNQGMYQVLTENKIPCKSLRFHYRPSVYPWSKSITQKLLFIPRLCGRLITNSLATLQLIHIAKKYQPDIIHTNVSVISIGYYAAKFLKIPHVWHIREYGAIDFNTFYYYPTFKTQLSRYKEDHSYTICITKDIQKYNKLTNWDKSRVIYDGVLSSKSLTYNPNKKPYFLFAGRLERIKGILPLIDAYAVYCKNHLSPLPLYIAGSGSESYTQLIQDRISHHKIENHVVLLGLRNDILSLYHEAKALIVPSLTEGFGFITAEAMFSGCLVIGYDVAGTKEQLDNGKEITGEEIALRYSTQEQLVQHLINVTDNSIVRYEQMIRQSQQIVSSLYTTEIHSKQIYEYYNYILGL